MAMLISAVLARLRVRSKTRSWAPKRCARRWNRCAKLYGMPPKTSQHRGVWAPAPRVLAMVAVLMSGTCVLVFFCTSHPQRRAGRCIFHAETASSQPDILLVFCLDSAASALRSCSICCADCSRGTRQILTATAHRTLKLSASEISSRAKTKLQPPCCHASRQWLLASGPVAVWMMPFLAGFSPTLFFFTFSSLVPPLPSSLQMRHCARRFTTELS